MGGVLDSVAKGREECRKGGAFMEGELVSQSSCGHSLRATASST